MSASSQPEARVAAPKPARTALDEAVEREMTNIQKFLVFVCGKRGVRGDDALDAIGATFVAAFKRERQGVCWDPKVESVQLHLAGILVYVLRSKRRSFKRKPTSPIGEDEDFASLEAGAAEELEGHEEETRRAAEVRKVLAAETRAGLTLRLLDALRKGIEGHAALAEHLQCTVEDVRAAYKRINRRTQRFREAGAAGKP